VRIGPKQDDETVMVAESGRIAAVSASFGVFFEVSEHKRTVDHQGAVLRAGELQRAFDEPCAKAGSLQGGWNLGVHQHEGVWPPLVRDKGDVPIFDELEATGFAVIANVFEVGVSIHE
jgi:hypothetical protein